MFSLLNVGRAGRLPWVTGEWLMKFRRERRVLARVRRAAWRLEQAERERDWAWADARGEKGVEEHPGQIVR